MGCLKTNFYKDGTRKDGLRTSCKVCTSPYHYNFGDKKKYVKKDTRKNFVSNLANNIRCRTS